MPLSSDSGRIQVEDALKHLHEADESLRVTTMESLGGALGMPSDKAAGILATLVERGLAEARGTGFGLTSDGRLYARQVLRTHRLYETWLARETGVPATEWHRRAHAAEHRLPPAEVDALADRLDHPFFDPHGDPIPTREGRLPGVQRIPLPEWPTDSPAIVDHLEDEPEALFRKLEALGLRPGMTVRTRRLDHGSFELLVEGRQVVVAPDLAGMIHLVPIKAGAPDESIAVRLSTLRPGGRGVIHGLSPACTGAERRRLLDLGLVPGTPVRCEFASPFRWPMSYLVRGTLIALRREQADRILLVPPSPPEP